MSLRIRRGTEAQRLGFTPDMGEIIWTTNGEKLYVGDGVTPGGKNIAAQLAGVGLVYNNQTGKLDSAVSFTTDQVAEGINNKYFSNELAQDAIGAAILAGTQSGITVTYTDNGSGAGSINFTVTPDGVGITQVSDDTTPALGGDLDLNSNDITGIGNVNITGTLAASAGLGANLELNSYTIIGTGNIDITGDVDATTVNATTVNATINGVINTNSIVGGVGAITVESNSPEYISTFVGLTNGTLAPRVALRASKGTNVSTPVNTTAGDRLGQFNIQGYADNIWKDAVSISAIWDPAADLTDESPASSLVFITNTGTGVKYGVFSSKGAFNAEIMQPRAFASVAARDSSITSPEEGMMVYISNICKFQGYVSDTGIAGGGSPNTTPGWVNLN
jgi:hypothetical protein